MQIQAEQLAYWYLRLNGFLTIPNFIVHPNQGNNQGTDVDILGVRFPFRSELHPKSMIDDEYFSRHTKSHGDKSFIALAEVKTSLCKLNGAWTAPEKQNMHRVFHALGIVPNQEVGMVAKSLYEVGYYTNQLYYVSMVCIGQEENPDITKGYPDVPQLTWGQILTFIHKRFRDFHNPKRAHGQWDQQGRDLWDCVEQHRRDIQGFIGDVHIVG